MGAQIHDCEIILPTVNKPNYISKIMLRKIFQILVDLHLYYLYIILSILLIIGMIAAGKLCKGRGYNSRNRSALRLTPIYMHFTLCSFCSWIYLGAPVLEECIYSHESTYFLGQSWNQLSWKEKTNHHLPRSTRPRAPRWRLAVHFFPMHTVLSFKAGHSFPPFRGSWITFLVRDLAPRPQGLLHAPYSSHSPTSQSSATKIEQKTFTTR